MSEVNLYGAEKRAMLSLALIFAFRMLGLFMILPVFAPYAHNLTFSTPTLIGLALGIYGLTQACLQIPFGMLSDKLGRKPIITLGLILFAIGSVIAACSSSIYGVILGRGLQGAGAIGSTLIATVADLTREENRTKAMATIGMTIGLSFSIAIFTGPILNSWVGVQGIFAFTAVLACGGLLMLHFVVPTPRRLVKHSDSGAIPALFKRVLTDGELLRLDFGIFAQHAILTALFIAIPMILEQSIDMPSITQWKLYLPILVASFALMVPLIIIAEKKRRMKFIFVSAIATLAISQMGLWFFHESLGSIGFWLLMFFTAFNVLEASLPSLVSKIAPVGSKGTAMGVYSSSQFFGIFCGGTIGGWLYGNHHVAGVFYASALLAAGWFIIALTMNSPRHLSSRLIAVGDIDDTEAKHIKAQLQQIPGVAEVAVLCDEGTAYLKVDNDIFNPESLTQLQLGETHG